MSLRAFPPETADGTSIHSEAFDLAVQELAVKHPDLVSSGDLHETLVLAIVDLAAAGQTDPVALARYAVHRAETTFRPIISTARER